MLFTLRLIGMLNAAVWLGATISFVLVVASGFSSEAMLRLLPVAHAGAAGLIMGERFYVLQYCCGSIALVHVMAEWLYAGKSLDRWPTYLLTALFALALLGGLSFHPRAQRLHKEWQGLRSTPQQRERAGSSFQSWQFLARAANVLTIFGLAVYVWQISAPETAARFSGTAKFKGLTNNIS